MRPRGGSVDDAGTAVSPRLRETLRQCLARALPPGIALMRLAEAARDASELAAALAESAERAGAGPAPPGTRRRRDEIALLLRDHPDTWRTVKDVLHAMGDGRGADSGGDPVDRWTAAFDRAARLSPEAGVALYALGDPALLAAATGEVAALMARWDLLGSDRALLEIGCGIGRFQAALAARAQLVVGLDISAAMLALAKERCAGHANAHFIRGSGRDLAAIGDGRLDLVFAVDSFPYLVHAGPNLALRHLRESARVLKPGGDLFIANFSYRGDPEADRRDLAALGGETGFVLRRWATGAFVHWDGTAFHLARQS
jgi:SAM-dependent methyltransferase